MWIEQQVAPDVLRHSAAHAPWMVPACNPSCPAPVTCPMSACSVAVAPLASCASMPRSRTQCKPAAWQPGNLPAKHHRARSFFLPRGGGQFEGCADRCFGLGGHTHAHVFRAGGRRTIYSCSQHLTTPGWGGVGSLVGSESCARTQNARADKSCTQPHATLGSRPAPARLF